MYRRTMPIRLTPRQEKACQLLRENGGNQRHAYAGAGFAARMPRKPTESGSVDSAASRLFKSDKVQKRLQELAAMATKRHEITVDTLLDDLETDRRLAHQAAQSGAAVAATMAKAKLLGLVVERKEAGAPGEFSNLHSIADVLDVIRKEFGDQAAEALAALVAAPREPDPIAPPGPTHSGNDRLN